MNIFRQPRELIVIRNPFEPQEFEQYKGHDLDALIRQAFPQGINDSVRFYHGNLLQEVFAERDKQGVDKLLKTEGRIYAVIKPMGLEAWVVSLIVSVVVSVAAMLLMPMPNMNQQSAPPSPNNALAQRTNRQRLGGRIVDIFGTGWSFPDLIAPTYSVYINHDETEYSLMCVGRGYYDIQKAYDDTTPVEQILGSTVDVFNPNVGVHQAPTKRFGNAYSELENKFAKMVVKRYTSVNGQVLAPPDNILSSDNIAAKPNGVITATDADFRGQFGVGDAVKITEASELKSANNLLDPSGNPVTYNLDGSYVVTSVSKTSVTLDVSGSSEWAKLTANADYTDGKFNVSTSSQSLWQGWFYADNGDFTDLMLNIVAPNGLYSSGQDGNWRPAKIDYLVESQVLDANDNILSSKSQNFSIAGRLREKYGNSWTYDDGVRRSAAQTVMIPIPVRQNSADKVRFRIRRITNTITSRTNTTIQEIKIKDFYSCRYMHGYEQSYDATIVYTKTKATEGALAVKERKLRLLVQRYVKNWQDNDNLILSNRADDIIYHIARDEKLANLLPSQIDMAQIKAEIDAVIDNFKTPLCAEFCYTFDDNNVSAEEMLQIVSKAVFSTCYRFNNQLKLLFERSIPVSVAIFNSHNILPDTFDKSESFGNEYDGVIIDYVDPVDDATMTINTSDSITNPKKDKIMGVRNKVQAHMHMMRIWNKLQFSYKSCEFTGGDESGIVIRSNRITVADQSRADVQQGSVENLEMIDNQIVLSTSNPVSLDSSEHTLFVQTVDGNVDAIPCSTLNDYQVVLSRLPSGQIAIGHDNVVNAVYQIVKTQDSGRDAYLVSEKSPDKGLTNRLTCINYDERYYQNDSDYQKQHYPNNYHQLTQTSHQCHLVGGFFYGVNMSDIMTVEQMQKGSQNLDTLEAWVEGAPNTTIKTPNGRVVPTMSTAVAKLTTDGIMQGNKTQRQVNTELDIKINSVSGGYFKAFDTLANLNAATGMTAGQVAKVMNDSDATANGDYYFDGSSWIKGYDALTDAKNYTNANPMFKKVQLKAGDDLDYIVNSGIYYNSSDLTATQLKNMPEMYGNNTVLGTLVVYSVYENKAAAVHQIFYPHTGNHFYSRSTNTSGVFGAWEKSVTKADIDLLKNKTQVQMLSLEQAQTLDVLTMPAGKYSWADFPEGRALTNMPPVDHPYGLLEIKETANGISGSYRMAIFYPYGRHKEFWINKNFETGWTGWMRYDDTETIKKSLNFELIHLPNDTDVLTLDVGTYVVDDFSIGNTFANMPNTPYKLGRLEVKHTGGLGGVPFKTVIFYPYGHADNSFYINTSYEAGAWTGWRTYKSYEDIKAEINAAATNAVSYIPNLIMPPKFYALPGTELHIYPEHLVVDDCESYNHSVVANRGQHRKRGFVWTPSTGDSVGGYGLTWTLFDKQSAKELSSAFTRIMLVDKNKDAGITKKVMVIGDSYINGGVITQQILDLANNDVTKVQLIGTRGSVENKHEGRSGWKISDYATAGRTYVKLTVSGVTTAPTWNTTTYTYNGVTFTVLETAISNGSGTITAEYFGGSLTDGASGTFTKTNNSAGDATINFSNLQKLSGNPFWYNGQVDFGRHLTANSLATPDIVLIELGVNDCFGQTTDDGVVSLTATAFSQLDTLIASIKATNSNVKIGLCLSPKYADQDTFGIDYGASYTSWRCSRNIAIWNRELIKRYKDSDPQNIYVVASGFNVDTLTSYPTEQQPINSHNSTLIDVQSNSVHPYNKGYLQIGDAMFAFIKAI